MVISLSVNFGDGQGACEWLMGLFQSAFLPRMLESARRLPDFNITTPASMKLKHLMHERHRTVSGILAAATM